MSYEIEDQLIERITAPLRRLHEHPPAPFGEAEKAMLLHGTTIGAILVNQGKTAVAFSDGKVSMGNKPVHLAYRKIVGIDHHTVMLVSGSPVLGLAYAGALKTYIGFHEDTSGQKLSARAKARFLGRTLMGGLHFMSAGILCAPILVTFDVREKKIPRIFSLGPDGSEIEHTDFATSGSGANIDAALRQIWRFDLSVQDGIEMARKLILTTAPGLDSYSGGEVSIEVIDATGKRTVHTSR